MTGGEGKHSKAEGNAMLHRQPAEFEKKRLDVGSHDLILGRDPPFGKRLLAY